MTKLRFNFFQYAKSSSNLSNLQLSTNLLVFCLLYICMNTFQRWRESAVKKSTIMKLIVSMLCVTMFTACGKRDSKKRRVGVYQGPPAVQASPGKDIPKKDDSIKEDDSTKAQNTGESETPDTTVTVGTGTDGNDVKLNPANNLPPISDDVDITDVSDSDESQLSNDNGSSDAPVRAHEPSYTKPIQNDQATTNNTVSNNAPRVHHDTGARFYEDTPFNPQLNVKQATKTNFKTNEGYEFTDLIDDNVMASLKGMMDADINTFSSENHLFEQQSKQLSMAINHVYSAVNKNNQTIKVKFEIGKHDNVFDNNILEFYGNLKDNQTARLSPTQNSDNFNYILDVVCLDRKATHCQNQQLILSYYYKKDADDGSYKKGSLCKRAYLVSRLGNATLNINANTDTGTDYIQHYVNPAEPAKSNSRACLTPAINNVEYSVTCLVDFVYNTLYKELYESCNDSGTTGRKKACSQTYHAPRGRFAQKIYMRTFAVAEGKAGYLVSIKDSEHEYLSLKGPLVDTNLDSLLITDALGSFNLGYKQMDPSFLTHHISDVLLNGIDSQSVIQLKLEYDGINQTDLGYKLQSDMTIDIIQRFPKVSLGLFKTNFPAPTKSELDDIKQDTDSTKDDDYSLKDKIKNFFKDSTLKVNAKDYTCEELKEVVQENKTVHVVGHHSLLGFKFKSSADVQHEQTTCAYGMGDDHDTNNANFKTKDKKVCHIGYICNNNTGR